VLRGGDLPVASSLKNLRDVYEKHGVWGICASTSPGKSLAEAENEVRFGNRSICRSLSHELANEGWPVVLEPGHDWPNGLLTFPNGEPDSEEWDRLRAHMVRRGLRPNPRYKGK
jgi:hypothetical protein